MKRFVLYLFLTADSKTAKYLNIIYGFAGLVGLLIVLIVSLVCFKIFKRYVACNYEKRFGNKNIKKSMMESNKHLDMYFFNFNMHIC